MFLSIPGIASTYHNQTVMNIAFSLLFSKYYRYINCNHLGFADCGYGQRNYKWQRLYLLYYGMIDSAFMQFNYTLMGLGS